MARGKNSPRNAAYGTGTGENPVHGCRTASRTAFARRPIGRAAVVALLCAVPLVTAGCHDRRHRHVDPHPSAFASSTEFTWTGDLRSYDALDEYLWNTVWDEVFVEFEAFDFHGEVRVQIFDDAFDEVFDETYFGTGGNLVVNTSSELGFSGEWLIRITSFDVFGDVTLRLD